ncbi:probable E3 ubiquitin-protein ligase RHY1A [Diospyros lotus]|uniref:probable E3 ubiquitin-protein ligase RHY1A n=1 Tax=Diospyros lotus TaxID=55363 RepID=UPI002258EF63|nr:probable E3 ubiquitin-protein ligase RHY1A [Diospyros lotus]XP_052192718.1 probable E3 ubiquitin-protein ligase RHY1A [Diospyros lotus]
MTSASELFYGRRSRFGRNSLDLGGLDWSLDRSFHHPRHGSGSGAGNRRRQHQQNPSNNSGGNNTRREHHDLDGCDPFRRPGSSLIRHHLHSNRPSNSAERDTIRLDEGSSQSSSSSTINLENIGGTHNRQRLNGNDRLPGAVILARERLLERLRGVALSGNRRTNRTSTGNNRGAVILGDDFRLIAGDWETNFPRDLVPQETSNRPPGLSREALNCLKVEVFSKTKCSSSSNKGEMSRVFLECSICLENFLEGDELLCLTCGHRFHSGCLYPWVRTCGDCPYCRREIVVSSSSRQLKQ